MQERYKTEVIPAMMKEFGYASVMQVPKMNKVTLNIGVGEAVINPKAMEAAFGDLTKIAGQLPQIRKAKKSIAVYKLREGMEIGCMATLRRLRMWHFLDRMISVALPRVRDFRGLSRRAFDGHGNYSLGVKEQIIFPEISYDEIDKIRGLNITLNTSARTDEEGLRLLELMGIPFRRQ